MKIMSQTSESKFSSFMRPKEVVSAIASLYTGKRLELDTGIGEDFYKNHIGIPEKLSFWGRSIQDTEIHFKGKGTFNGWEEKFQYTFTFKIQPKNSVLRKLEETLENATLEDANKAMTNNKDRFNPSKIEYSLNFERTPCC